MPKRPAPPLVPRKRPRQARSTELVGAILKAAIRVLERDGAAAFTTIRVAERAGVSVGSLYQYFPNKESILFRLQEDEWEATTRLLDGIFADATLRPAERLRAAMVAFFRTERDEAPLRRALGAAAPLYETSQSTEHLARSRARLAGLIAAAAPRLPKKQRAFAAELYVALLEAMGEHVSETAQSRAEVDHWGEVVAAMFLGFIGARAPSRAGGPYRSASRDARPSPR
ncbi:MAG TPA: TetR/AcrR family transcriptional regulator [Polyangiaceae bacterium]|nr:TetR/AcrR family transcriptional regulator [Polyangiaceae bacterium]